MTSREAIAELIGQISLDTVTHVSLGVINMHRYISAVMSIVLIHSLICFVVVYMHVYYTTNRFEVEVISWKTIAHCRVK